MSSSPGSEAPCVRRSSAARTARVCSSAMSRARRAAARGSSGVGGGGGASATRASTPAYGAAHTWRRVGCGVREAG
jgi:hypothetical protein